MAVATRTISCEDCGHDYETARANTKYCGLCRLCKDLNYIGLTTKECWLCRTEFAPLERKEALCGGCAYQVKRHGETACAFCGEVRLRVRGDVGVCNDCARNPEHRRAFLLAVMKKVVARREEA